MTPLRWLCFKGNHYEAAGLFGVYVVGPTSLGYAATLIVGSHPPKVQLLARGLATVAAARAIAERDYTNWEKRL
jgi:hypothetical protein